MSVPPKHNATAGKENGSAVIAIRNGEKHMRMFLKPDSLNHIYFDIRNHHYWLLREKEREK